MELTKREEKMLAFLRDVRKLTMTNPSFSMSELIIRHGVNSSTSAALKKAGVMKNIGGPGAAAHYKWDTVTEPNLHMARGIMELNSQAAKKYVVKRKPSVTIEKSITQPIQIEERVIIEPKKARKTRKKKVGFLRSIIRAIWTVAY